MKLIKSKILTATSGLLTLSGLIMLFLALCNQMDKADHFLDDKQVITLGGNANSAILLAVVLVVLFGVMFFASWVKTRRVKARGLRHHSHHVHA